ncbi:hypothetical protein MKW94_028858 [Papaver nudicaule]|uniref:Bet v I/Major latex protein domain-containing protein n=1 Tax=Papaver nudicaule TaxID=74823 RepID=A0AA41VFU1_PAPNU|nr:hypothetical protein [Papaver nudicaule]
MRYEFTNEFEVKASADDVWAIYSSSNLRTSAVQLLPSILKSKDILEGDGCSVGTIFRVVFLPARYNIPMYREKIVTVDHQKRLKEIQTIEGGYLEMGCTFCMLSFEILAKEANSCVIKTVTKYEVNDDLPTSVSNNLHIVLNACIDLARGVSKHITEKNASAAN